MLGSSVNDWTNSPERSSSVNNSSNDSSIADDTLHLTAADIGDLSAEAGYCSLYPGVEETLGSAGARGPATLAWRDLSVHVTLKQGKLKKLVNNVSGIVKPGTLVALMGSSGAGKTTLMTALAYRNPVGTIVEGEIQLNGREVGEFMHRESGYMHQDDLFVESLTLLEHLTIMARLKMDRRTSRVARVRRINLLLRQLGLYSIRHSRIGHPTGPDKLLSGGERKRLSFATELLTDPSMLFCDEPTTGLDSYSAQKLVKLMRDLAGQGRTVVCTIHQPSSELFEMFNQLILLAEGRVAYAGTARGALQFFDSLGYECPLTYNPTDFFIQVLALTPGSEKASRTAIKSICDRFAVSDAAKEYDMDIQLEMSLNSSQDLARINGWKKPSFKDPFFITKLFWLVYRCSLVVIRDPKIQFFKIIQKLVMAVTAGLCYVGTARLTQAGIQSVQGALFIIIAENSFSPMYSILYMFPEEFPLFHRELRAGLYTTSLYYIAKILSLMPGLVVESTLFTTVVYWLAGLRASGYAFALTLLLAAIVLNIAIACGSFFSCAFGSMPVAIAYLVPFDYSLMVTSGIFIKLSTLPSYVAWVRYLSWLMYSNEAMSILQWDGVQNITCETPGPDFPCVSAGEQVLEQYDFQPQNFWDDLYALLGLYLAFHTLAYVCLRHRARRK